MREHRKESFRKVSITSSSHGFRVHAALARYNPEANLRFCTVFIEYLLCGCLCILQSVTSIHLLHSSH
jgi:hypothetical protein